MSTVTLIIIITLLLAFTTQGGLIKYHSITLSPQNVQQVHTIELKFQISNTIQATDYIYLKWPYRIFTTGTEIIGSWGYSTNCINFITNSSLTTKISTNNVATSEYFVSFLQDLKPQSLDSTKTYSLKFTSVQITSAAAYYGPIVISTVSDNQESYIEYDFNNVVDPFYMYPQPGNTINAVANLNPKDQTVKQINSAYEIQLDLQFSQSIVDSARIQLQLTNQIFNFLPNSCQNIQVVGDANFKVLSIQLIEYQQNLVTFHVGQSLQSGASNKIRIKCQIQNPKYPSNSQLLILTKKQKIEAIIETITIMTNADAGDLYDQIEVTPLTWDESKIKVQLGWGVDVTDPVVPQAFRLYKDASGISEKFYNNIKLLFEPPASLPTCLKLTFNTIPFSGTAANNPIILKNSIYHNLPQCGNSAVTHQIVNNDIVLENVGQISSDTYYELAFKMNIPNTVTAGVSIGGIQIDTHGSVNTRLVNRLSDNDLLVDTPLIKNVIIENQRLDQATPQLKEQLIFTTGFSELEADGTEKEIIISHDTDTNLIDTTANNPGIEYYMSYGIELSELPTCSISKNDDSASSDTMRFCVVDKVSLEYTLVKFALLRGTPNSDLFGATAVKSRFKIQNAKINRPSEYAFINEQVYDIYARSVTGLAISTTTTHTTFSNRYWFFNGYALTISNAALFQNLDLSYVNWLISNSGGNDATQFPTLLRVSGQLSSLELANTNKLIIFFNNFELISQKEQTQEPSEIYCGGAPEGLKCYQSQNNYGNTLQAKITKSDLITHQRVIIQLPQDVLSGKEFNFYLPLLLGNTDATRDIALMVATASEITPQLTEQGIFQTVKLKSWTPTKQYTHGPTPLTPTSPSISQFSDLSTKNVGEISSARLADQTSSLNLGNSKGSGITLCSNYNFYNLIDKNLAGTPGNRDTCSGLDYKISTSSHIYCVICPYSVAVPANIDLDNFKFPFIKGVDIDDFYVAYSGLDPADTNPNTNDKPRTLRFSTITQAGTLKVPNTLSITNVVAFPITFAINSKNNKVTLTIESKIDLPKQFIIMYDPDSTFNWLAAAQTCLFKRKDQAESYSCTQTTPNYRFQVTNNNGNKEFTEAGIFEFSIYIDVKSSLTSIDDFFGLQILVQGSSAIVQQQITASKGSRISYTTSQSTNSMIAQNFTYVANSFGIKSVISLELNLQDKIITQDDVLRIKSNELSVANTDLKYNCYILFKANQTVSSQFKQCIIKNNFATGIDLVPQSEIVPSNDIWTIIFEVITLPTTQPSNTLSIEIYRLSGTPTQIASTTIAFPSLVSNIALPSSGLSIQKLPNSESLPSQLTLTFTSTTTAYTQSSIIFLIFPRSYPDNLGTSSLYCIVGSQNIQVSCTQSYKKVLKITAFTGNIPASQSVTIKIYGLLFPTMPTTEKIILIYDGSNTQQYEIAEYNDVGISSAVNTVKPFSIDSYTLSNQESGKRVDIDFTINIENSISNADSILYIAYPDKYGYYPQHIIPTYTITKNSIANPSNANTIVRGSTIGIPLKQTFDQGNKFQVKIFNVWSGSLAPCHFTPPKVFISSSQTSTDVIQRGVFNTDQLTIQNTGSRDLIITHQNGTEVSELYLVRGIFGPKLFFKPRVGRFSRDITLTPSDSNIKINPNTIKGEGGTSQFEFNLGYTIGSPTSSLFISFTKQEEGNAEEYNPVNSILVYIISGNAKQIALPTYVMGVGGTSPVTTIDLRNAIPVTDLNITITLSSADFDTNTFSLKFNKTSQRSTFQVDVKSAVQNGRQLLSPATITGASANAYQLVPTFFTISTVLPVTQVNEITKIDIKDIGKYVTKINVEVITTQDSTIYIGLYLSKKYKTPFNTCADLKRLSTVNYGIYNRNDPMQSQFIKDATNNRQLFMEFSSLRSNEHYSLGFCTENEQKKQSSLVYREFLTKDNQASLSRLTLEFNQNITKLTLVKIICELKVQLAVKQQNIFSTQQGTIYACGQTQAPENITNVQKFEFMVQGDAYTELIDDTQWRLETFVYHMGISSTPQFIKFKSFLASLNSTLELSKAYSISGLEFSPPAFGRSLTVSRGINFVRLSNIDLANGPGFIYGIAVLRLGSTIPIPYQIIQGVGGNGQTARSNSVFYDGSSPATLQITGLTGGEQYYLYVIASNNDQSDVKYTTGVASIPFNTQLLPKYSQMLKYPILMLSVLLLLLV